MYEKIEHTCKVETKKFLVFIVDLPHFRVFSLFVSERAKFLNFNVGGTNKCHVFIMCFLFPFAKV